MRVFTELIRQMAVTYLRVFIDKTKNPKKLACVPKRVYNSLVLLPTQLHNGTITFLLSVGLLVLLLRVGITVNYEIICENQNAGNSDSWKRKFTLTFVSVCLPYIQAFTLGRYYSTPTSYLALSFYYVLGMNIIFTFHFHQQVGRHLQLQVLPK